MFSRCPPGWKGFEPIVVSPGTINCGTPVALPGGFRFFKPNWLRVTFWSVVGNTRRSSKNVHAARNWFTVVGLKVCNSCTVRLLAFVYSLEPVNGRPPGARLEPVL